ncbi:Protein MSN1 [Cytospora mali]|uniref:Protein MSN1 n=1 Tax=Cytospora mali TaxID=578113 RepID=A0A194VYP6_CYTMA|nr:Protein MSN1 [Valsa mali]
MEDRDHIHRHTPSSRAPSEATVQGLKDKTAGELVSTILQMQSSHEQQVADLQRQLAVISRQMEQLTSILNAHFTSQIAAIRSVQQDIVSISPQQQASRPSRLTDGTNGAHALPHPYVSASSQPPASVPLLLPGLVATPEPRGGVATPTPSQDRFETPFNPSQTPTSPDNSLGKTELDITFSSDPNQPPTVKPSRLDTVAEVWEEYRYGRNGNLSVESLEARWGPRWRRDYEVLKWFRRVKIITDKIKQYVADGIDEQTAVNELQAMRQNRSLKWLSRELEDDRRLTKKQWKAARVAAIANKQAMLSSGTVPADRA